MNSVADIELLSAALLGYQSQLATIDERIAEIRARLRGRTDPVMTADGSSAPTGKGHMSAVARARIASTQRKRSSASHKEKGTTAPSKKASRGGKRKLSPTARKAIAEIFRHRTGGVTLPR
jgi:hypothetical protein